MCRITTRDAISTEVNIEVWQEVSPADKADGIRQDEILRVDMLSVCRIDSS